MRGKHVWRRVVSFTGYNVCIVKVKMLKRNQTRYRHYAFDKNVIVYYNVGINAPVV